MKTKRDKNTIFILLRYITCVLFSLNNIFLFYFILTPITINVVYFFLKLFSPNVILQGSTIFFNNHAIQLLGPCIAGSAYFLLFILNFTTPMPVRKRILSLLFSFLFLFVINIARILIFSILFTENFSLFNTLHLFVWYCLSGIFIFFIWVATIKTFKIKQIPVYSDFKYLLSLIQKKSRK